MTPVIDDSYNTGSAGYDLHYVKEANKDEFLRNTPSNDVKSYEEANHYQYGIRVTVSIEVKYVLAHILAQLFISRADHNYFYRGNAFWFGDHDQSSTSS